MTSNNYPNNLIRKIYDDDKDENKHVNTTYLKGLYEQIETLNEKEKLTLNLRFEKELTLGECSVELGLSSARIAQIVHSALRKLRHSSRRNHHRAVPKHQLKALARTNNALTDENELLKAVLRAVINKEIDPQDLIIVTELDALTQLLFTTIEQLGLSTRAYNALKRSGVNTFEGIINQTESGLLKMNNFGQGSLVEIKKLMNTHNLTFGSIIDRQIITTDDIEIFTRQQNENQKLKIKLD